LKLDWRGALRDWQDHYTSVDLQHKALEWWETGKVRKISKDAPADMQAELVRMTWLNDQELWAIANSMMSEEGQKQLADLTDLQAQRQLTQDERETMNALRQEYGRTTLRKARAYALLSMRGGRLLLADD